MVRKAISCVCIMHQIVKMIFGNPYGLLLSASDPTNWMLLGMVLPSSTLQCVYQKERVGSKAQGECMNDWCRGIRKIFPLGEDIRPSC